MKLLRLTVKRFRGIKELEWNVGGSTACLLGPGDSSKSTILTAIEYCLYSGWGLQVFDADFFDQDTSEPIEIIAVIGDLPDEAMSDAELGLSLNGFRLSDHKLSVDPDGDFEPVVAIRFRVAADLEPEWFTKKTDTSEEIALGRRRRHFRVVRLTEKVDGDLGWSRNSALARMTSTAGTSTSHLPEVYRAANEKFAVSEIESLKEAAAALESELSAYNVKASGLVPGLLQASFLAKGGAIGLFEEKVPMLQKGLGTRRLVALALQKKTVTEHSLILIDEIETGLEPYRIEGLLRSLGCQDPEAQANQLIFTTHSPTPILRLPIELLHFVRSDNGRVSVKRFANPIEEDLRRTIKSHAAALLARKIVVGEGKTEFGLIRALFSSDMAGDKNLMACAADVVDGVGNASAPNAAIQLQKMGYAAFLLADSDAAINPSQEEVEEAGAKVFLWPDGMSTEERIAADLPDDGVAEMVRLGIANTSVDPVRSQLINAAAADCTDKPALAARLTTEPLPNTFSTSERKTIGLASKKGKWFKTIDGGETLAKLIAKHLSQMMEKPTALGLAAVREWLESEQV